MATTTDRQPNELDHTAAPITVRFRWTAEEFLVARRYAYRHSVRPVFRFAIHFIFVLMIVLGIAAIVDSGSGDDAHVLAYAFLAAGITRFALMPFEPLWIKYVFKKRPDCDQEIEWTFDPTKLTNRTQVSHGEVAWAAFAKAVITPKGVLLYPNNQIFHWIPKTGFESEETYERFLELLRAKIATTVPVR